MKKLFQKETFQCATRFVCAMMAVCLFFGAEVVAEDGRLSSEKMLESVVIDDLVNLGRIEREKEAAKVAEAIKLELEDDAKSSLATDTVVKSEMLLDERLILDEIRHQIASHFQLKDDFKIYFEQPWKEIKLEDTNWEVVMTSFPSQGLRSRFYVSFEIWVAGKRHSTWQQGMRSELWVDTYVTLQRIDRGTVLRDGLVTIRPVDSLSLYQGLVEIGTNLNDFEVINGLKAGEPLVWRDLRERPLIQKNALIDVVAEEGLFKITLKAKALEDGVKGQIIRIRNLQSHNDIQAEVIGVNQAKVYF